MANARRGGTRERVADVGVLGDRLLDDDERARRPEGGEHSGKLGDHAVAERDLHRQLRVERRDCGCHAVRSAAATFSAR